MTDTTSTTTRRQARKPARLIGMTPAPDIESYASVPWYRRQQFALFPLFTPALIFIALTGHVYTTPTGTMRAYSDATVWRYGVVSRAFFVAVSLIVTVTVASLIWG